MFFSIAPAEILDSNIFSVVVYKILVLFDILVGTSQINMVHVGPMFCFFPARFISSTYTDKNSPFSRITNKHSQFGTFSHPYFHGTFSNCVSHTIRPENNSNDFGGFLECTSRFEFDFRRHGFFFFF